MEAAKEITGSKTNNNAHKDDFLALFTKHPLEKKVPYYTPNDWRKKKPLSGLWGCGVAWGESIYGSPICLWFKCTTKWTWCQEAGIKNGHGVVFSNGKWYNEPKMPYFRSLGGFS